MSGAQPRVLMVDDEQSVLTVCGETLQQAGYVVRTVGTGTEALQLFSREAFDVAVLDLVLPDIDGLTLLAALREADPDLLVILMTGHATLEAAIEAVRRGAYDFLRKPFSATELTRVLSRGLERRQLALQNQELVRELDRMNQDLRHQVGAVTEELTAFLNLGRRLSGTDGPLPILLEILRAAMQLTTARSGVVCRFLPDESAGPEAGGRFRCVAAEGEAAADLSALDCEAEEAPLRQCLETRQPVIIPELLADPEAASGAFALLGLSSVLAVPLLAVSGCMGAMLLFDPVEPFSDRQASLVKVLVAQAAEVVAQAGLRGLATRGEGAAGEFVDLQDILSARQQG